jgi:hypothetical protein
MTPVRQVPGCRDGVWVLLAAADARRRTPEGTNGDQWSLGRYSRTRGRRSSVNGGNAPPRLAAGAATSGLMMALKVRECGRAVCQRAGPQPVLPREGSTGSMSVTSATTSRRFSSLWPCRLTAMTTPRSRQRSNTPPKWAPAWGEHS